MRITSPEFESGAAIPARFTCDGDDVRPTLRIIGVPEAVASVAVIVDDPDAPNGEWVHWTCWNLPTSGEDGVMLVEGPLPDGAVQGTTDFGATGYRGPCPPSGVHNYFFKAYALDVLLELPAGASKADVEAAMDGHVLDKAGLVGTYGRGA